MKAIISASVICVYIFIVYVIGFIASKSIKNSSDYIIGSRKLKKYTIALGAGASDMSGWLMMALPGIVFLNGVSEIWLPIGLMTGAYLNWEFVAKRLRNYTEKYGNSLTIPWYFSNRFNDKSGFLRIITASAIAFFFVIYIASALVSSAFVLEMIMDIDYHYALVLSAIVIVIYTTIGGFLAVNLVDVFQGFLMLFALIVVPFAMMNHLGGIENALEIVKSKGINISNPMENVEIIKVISLLAWGVGYCGQPHILVRFMGAKNSNIMDQSKKICMSWMILSLIGAFFVGLLGPALFSESSLSNPETIFLYAAESLFPVWVAAILFAAVLSAVMSTIAAQLLVASSSLVEDILLQMTKSKFIWKNDLAINRIMVILITVVSVIMAYNPKNTILGLVSYAWAGLGSTIGPVVLFSLYWDKVKRAGAICGIIAASITVIIWQNNSGGIFDLYAILPGFVVGCIGIVTGTYIEINMSKSKKK